MVRLTRGVAAALIGLSTVCAGGAAWADPHYTGTPHTVAPYTGTLSAQDRSFLDDAASGQLFEVAAGEVALLRAVDPRVRAFAQRMINDHSTGYERVRSLDTSLGLTTPFAADRAQRAILRVLAQLHGRAFDCSYLPTEYDDHVGDVLAFQVEAREGADPRVRRLAAAALPTLLEHRELAERDLTGLTC